MIKEETPLIKRFIDAFCYKSTEYIDWYNEEDEASNNENILIADYSHHIEIIYTDKVFKLHNYKSSWKKITFNGFVFKKGQNNIILWDGNFYSGFYLSEVFNKFFEDKPELEVMTLTIKDNSMLMFKIDNELSLVIGSRIDDIIIDNGKVVFIDYEDKDGELVEKGRYEVDWLNGKAEWKTKHFDLDYKVVLWDKSYLIEEVSEEGDSLLI